MVRYFKNCDLTVSINTQTIREAPSVRWGHRPGAPLVSKHGQDQRRSPARHRRAPGSPRPRDVTYLKGTRAVLAQFVFRGEISVSGTRVPCEDGSVEQRFACRGGGRGRGLAVSPAPQASRRGVSLRLCSACPSPFRTQRLNLESGAQHVTVD